MDDQIQTSADPVVDDQAVEAENSTQSESIEDVPTSKVTETPDQGEVTDDKPSRIERNLQKSLSKKKDLERENAELNQKLRQMQELFTPQEPEEPLFSEDEEFLTREDLAKRIDERIERKVEAKLKSAEEVQRLQQQYKATVDTHIEDLQKVEVDYPELNKDSPQFNERLFEQFIKNYEMVNYTPDGMFIGRKMGSELANEMVSLVRDVGKHEAAQVTGKMVQHAMSSAVAPSQSNVTSQSSETERLYQQAMETGKDEDWASYFKSKRNS